MQKKKQTILMTSQIDGMERGSRCPRALNNLRFSFLRQAVFVQLSYATYIRLPVFKNLSNAFFIKQVA